MAFDIELSPENNAGFDPDFILCSSNIERLIEFRKYSQTLVCRNPLAPEASAYVDSLMTDDRFAERMRYLHNVTFQVRLSNNGALVVTDDPHISPDPAYWLKMIKSRNGFKDTSNIADLFPEPEAAAFVASIEDYARQALAIHHKYVQTLPVIIGFHTLQQGKPHIYHTDAFPATVKVYNKGTRIGPFSAFRKIEDNLRHRNHYQCLDESQLVIAQPGDVMKPNHPHAEGLTDRFRLAIRAHNLTC